MPTTRSVNVASTTTRRVNAQVDLRPRDVRDAFDAAVMRCTSHLGRVSVGDVMARIGGSAEQIRTALARGVDGGLLGVTGVGRATRWYVPGVGRFEGDDA